MVQRFSTNEIPGHERFEYWSDAVCATYVQLGCETSEPENFNGAINLNRMSKVSTSFVSGSAQVVSRRMKDISSSQDNSFLISLQLENQCQVEQQGRAAQLRPGDFALYGSADPYMLILPQEFRQLVIQVPKSELLKRLPNADLLTAMPVAGDTKVGNLVSNSLLEFSKLCEEQGGILSDCFQDTIIDLMVLGLTSLGEFQFDVSNPEKLTMLRANRIIQSRFTDPEFSRIQLASELGVSVRRLSELFRLQNKSISAEIRECRLKEIANRLNGKIHARCSITEIAMDCGINNLQHFSKLFKNRFGMSPSDFRKMGAHCKEQN